MWKKLTIAFIAIKSDWKVFFYYCVLFFYNISLPSLKTLSTLELAKALQSGKSLIRVGDGEAMMYMGRSIHYQKHSPTLQKDITAIISSYSTASPYVLAVPLFALQNSVKELKNNKRLRIWRLFRALYKVRFNHAIPYADAVMFYHQNVFTQTLSAHIKDKKIIVVTKHDNITAELRDALSMLSTSVQYIEIPPTDAFSEMTKTIDNIDEACSTLSPSNIVILFAAGPAAKSFAYHYANKGFQALDIGHGIEIIGKTHDYSDRL